LPFQPWAADLVKARRANLNKDDPDSPWTIRVNQSLALDTEMMEFVCLENEKDACY
jgi:hypothetical protein